MTMLRRIPFGFVLTCAALASYSLQAQVPVPYERLLNTAKEPQNWLIYGGDYSSNRHSRLTQITPANVKSLSLAWAYQSPTTGSWQPTPLVVDGIMYLTQRPNDVVALDAVTGRVFWIYRYNNANEIGVCCGANNRGPRHSRRHAVHGHARRRTWWPSTPRAGCRSGKPKSPTARWGTRSRSRRWPSRTG